MAHIMPEVKLQKVIQTGLKNLRLNEVAFREIFSCLKDDGLADDYGEEYVDDVWQWFQDTQIPTVQAWSWDSQNVPSYSIHLASESEDEQNSAIGDHFAIGEDDEIGVSAFRVMLDVGIHANQGSDKVLILYYILNYVLFKEKRLAESFGLQKHTFSASDYNRDSQYMADNVYTRWVRFTCWVQNAWTIDQLTEYSSIEAKIKIESEDPTC